MTSELKRSTANVPDTSHLSKEKLEIDSKLVEEDKRTQDEEGRTKMERKGDEKKEPRRGKDECTKEDEKALRELEYYHGFVSREDLCTILKADGDFIVRMTEVGATKREIVLSLIMTIAPGEEGEKVHPEYTTLAAMVTSALNPNVKARNLVVRRTNGRYRIEGSNTFKTVKDLVEFYKKNHGQVNKHKFILKNGIPQQSWEFSHNDVKFTGKLLGDGAYGVVKEGTLNLTKKKGPADVKVAVKMAKGSCELSKEKIKEMMREARLMRFLQHKNVVRLYGVAVLEQPMYIILELINGDDMKKYLRAHRGETTTTEKLKMCLGAANGLDYLHRMGYIHRDIAARNCLYGEDKVAKISDFGLSRHAVNYKMKSNAKLPTRWLAPETIQNYTFTPKTDIYSYGVLVWEVFNDGDEPWGAKTSTHEVKKNALEGKFLELPPSCPLKLRLFVKNSIFLLDPAGRAPMSEAVLLIDSVLNEDQKNSQTIVPESKTKMDRCVEKKSRMQRNSKAGERTAD